MASKNILPYFSSFSSPTPEISPISSIINGLFVDISISVASLKITSGATPAEAARASLFTRRRLNNFSGPTCIALCAGAAERGAAGREPENIIFLADLLMPADVNPSAVTESVL